MKRIGPEFDVTSDDEGTLWSWPDLTLEHEHGSLIVILNAVERPFASVELRAFAQNLLEVADYLDTNGPDTRFESRSKE
jgi:hypothetical protein